MTLALELMGAELIEMLVAANSIVETLDVLEDFRLGLSPCWVKRFLICSLFKLLKNDSATALSQQLPRRLVLVLKRLSLHQRLNPSWLPGSEWMITESFGFLRQTAIVSASSTKLARMRDPILQPTTARECKSSTAAKYNQPSCVRM